MMDRRQFLFHLVGYPATFASAFEAEKRASFMTAHGAPNQSEGGARNVIKDEQSRAVTLFLSGDVMTGRGIDQILPHPSDPRLYEPYVRNAEQYVVLAEEINGSIAKPVAYDYIWGDLLTAIERARPHARIINLETSITVSDDHWRGKGINYRMHPDNAPCLTAAGIDCCVLANNHVLDWGYEGLFETLDVLQQNDIAVAGAGRDLEAAQAPAILNVGVNSRVLVFALGSPSSGIPRKWAAKRDRAGVNLLPDLDDASARRVADRVTVYRRPGDIVVISIHWGGNWGYAIPDQQQRFARWLVERGGIDIIHGHSSHHPKGIAVHQDRPVIYGCGDLLNDYEGIRGHEVFRGDLSLLYFVTIDPSTQRLIRFVMVPTRIKQFRLQYASSKETEWLRDLLNRLGTDWGTRVDLNAHQELELSWAGGPSRKSDVGEKGALLRVGQKSATSRGIDPGQ
jgi:poly-gamma-glutamate synthesis protein (capsule biosynthesis protein)